VSLAAQETDRPRVVVADDSAMMRALVGDILQRDGIEVVGAARDGDQALALCRRLEPDAMTLDLSMPGMGGIEVLRELRQGDRRLPVVVVSAFSPAQGAYAVDALAEGAFELVTKPTGSGEVDVFATSLVSRVKLAVATRRRRAEPAIAPPPRRATRPVQSADHVAKVVLIAVSTGGPRALAELVPQLPTPLGLGTLIVQHMPAGFTASLAARLDRASALSVREAAGDEELDPALALVAPGGRHLRLSDAGRTMLSESEPIGGLRPRADLLIEDAARRYGRRLLLVVMTGMGNDGLQGARAVKRQGGRVIVEAERTCTVYGMPRAVAEADLADVVAPLDALAAAICAEVTV
jgi:two-component system, chemotaxis family, protein-glutamate methylesterase/glutaminase